jgi:ABC-2 type transport system ATP-binding protein
MDDIIKVNGLKKDFGPDILAVDDISFNVKRGEIFGFLGPNGAGKSTTIKILTTLIRKTAGSVIIDGMNIDEESEAIRRIIGYASQEVGVDNDLTARENLWIQGRFYHLTKDQAKKKAEELLRTVDLVDSADRKVSTFSGGMRKRLDLATALVSDPKVLFLDEPTTGLDPKSRNELWEYIRKLNNDGATIFLTTQYMEEAERLADRLCIIDQGKIVAEGVADELKAQIGGDTIQISFKDKDPGILSKARELLSHVPEVKEVRDCNSGDICESGLVLVVPNGSLAMPTVVRSLDGQEIAVAKLILATPTLDDVFLKLTGKTLKIMERKDRQKSSAWGRRREKK